MMRTLLICLVVLFVQPLTIFADEQTTSTVEVQPPMTENGDTIVITAEEIRAMQAHKMADVLNHVPGVTASDSSVGIHGSYKVKVFVDGRPINDPTSSHGSIKWNLVSPSEVERVEILRGKGGLRYGQDASGGVILITTKRVRRLTGNAKTYGGNHGTGYGYANLQSSAGRWSVGLTGGFEGTDGFKVNNDKERWQVGARLAYTRDERRSAAFTADYLEDERGLSGLPEYPTPFSRKASDNTGLSLQANWQPVTSTTFFNKGRTHNTDSSRGIAQTLRVSELGEDLAASRKLGGWGDLNFGGAFRLSRARGNNFDDQRETTTSLFAQPHATLSGSVSLFYNRLSDRITYVTGDEGIGQYQNFGLVTYTGGDLAITWKPHATVNVKTSSTYLEAVDEETGLWLPAISRHKATLDLYWQPTRPISIVLTGKYVSEVYRNKANTKTVPEYAIAGLRAEYAFTRFSLFTDIDNLFDKTYYYADGLLAPPFNWVVGVNWRI